MEYPKEPFDFKLFVRTMLAQWYQFVICMLIGSLVFGISYYGYKNIAASAKEFEAEAVYYIQYVKDPGIGDAATYFNEYTLNSWISQDVFAEVVLENIEQSFTKEQLASFVTVTVPSDIRIFHVTIVTSDPELTMELLQGYDQAVAAFAQRQPEIQDIQCQDSSKEAVQIKADIRTQRAFVLGGVLGLVLGGWYIMLRYLLDDGIYVPQTLQKRHGITPFGSDDSTELYENIAYAVRNCKRVAVTNIGDAPNLAQVVERLQSHIPDKEWIAVPSMQQCPTAASTLRKQDGCVLIVKAKTDKSTAIDRALAYYAQQDVTVLGAVLWDGNKCKKEGDIDGSTVIDLLCQ